MIASSSRTVSVGTHSSVFRCWISRPVNKLCIVYQHPALGSQKSAWTNTQSRIQSRVQTKEGQSKNRQNRQTKTRNKQTQTKNTTKTNETRNTPFNGRALSKKAAYVPMNSRKILQKAKQPTRHHSKIAVKVQKQTPISSAETQDPPSQDPGDRTVKQQENSTFNRIGRAMNWDATQRQAPCRGKRSKKERVKRGTR